MTIGRLTQWWFKSTQPKGQPSFKVVVSGLFIKHAIQGFSIFIHQADVRDYKCKSKKCLPPETISLPCAMREERLCMLHTHAPHRATQGEQNQERPKAKQSKADQKERATQIATTLPLLPQVTGYI